MNTPSNKTIDVLFLGEAYVEFYGEQNGSTLQEMISFRKIVGGYAATIALGCARLGLKTSLITKRGEDPMGNFLMSSLQQAGVDLSQCKLSSQSTGIVLYHQESHGIFPKFHHHQARADMDLDESDIDPNIIATSKVLIIHASVFAHETMNRAARKAMIAARENQTQILLILEEHLTAHHQHTILPLCDLILGTEQAFKMATNLDDTFLALTQLRTLTNAIFIVNNPNELACYVLLEYIPTPWKNTTHYISKPIENPREKQSLEAFISGFLYGWLENHGLEKCCQIACANESLVIMQQNNTNKSLPSLDELLMFLSDQNHLFDASVKSQFFSHIRHVKTRVLKQSSLYLYHFGYLDQWQKLMENFNANESKIHTAQRLIAEGLKEAAKNSPFASASVDQVHPLHTPLPYFKDRSLLRSVDIPGEVPLQFKEDPDITRTLLQWPQHHVAKATMVYHPDDRYTLRGQQESMLTLLYRASRATSHELAIEIAPPTNSLMTASTIAHIMQRFYAIGVYPDWWLIQSPRDQRSWYSIARVIEENDPYCKGILINSQYASAEQLKVLFKFASAQKICKGFVMGRTVIQPLLEQWFADKIPDQPLIDMVGTLFHQVINHWIEIKHNMAASLEEVR